MTNKLFIESIASNFEQIADKIISNDSEFTSLDSSDLIQENLFTDKNDADTSVYQYGVISAVKFISKFERENFGDVLTDFNDTVNVANSLYFALSTEKIDAAMMDAFGRTYVESKNELKQVVSVMKQFI